jgi:hypothetical protein
MSSSILNPGTRREVNGQLHDQAAFPGFHGTEGSQGHSTGPYLESDGLGTHTPTLFIHDTFLYHPSIYS